MVGSLTVFLGIVAALLSAGSVAMFVRSRRHTRAQRALANDLEARLADAMGPGTGTHLERAPTVRRIAVLEDGAGDDGGDGRNGPDGDADDRPVYVPVVRVDLETADAPGMELIAEYVADVLETIHPELEARGDRVHRYDVEFTYGPDGLLVDGERRRVSVAPELAARLLEDERFDAFDLRKAIERGDRDDDTPTALWEEC